jgi:hypothetical protein
VQPALERALEGAGELGLRPPRLREQVEVRVVRTNASSGSPIARSRRRTVSAHDTGSCPEATARDSYYFLLK